MKQSNRIFFLSFVTVKVLEMVKKSNIWVDGNIKQPQMKIKASLFPSFLHPNTTLSLTRISVMPYTSHEFNLYTVPYTNKHTTRTAKVPKGRCPLSCILEAWDLLWGCEICERKQCYTMIAFPSVSWQVQFLSYYKAKFFYRVWITKNYSRTVLMGLFLEFLSP